jgi:hypothetical protein
MSLGDFFERAKFLFDVGCAAQITSVCMRSMPEQQWVSFTTKIVLAPKGVLRDDAPSVLVDLPTFRVVRSVVAAGDAKTFLTEVANGTALRARLARDVGHDIRFVNNNNADAPPQFLRRPGTLHETANPRLRSAMRRVGACGWRSNAWELPAQRGPCTQADRQATRGATYSFHRLQGSQP